MIRGIAKIDALSIRNQNPIDFDGSDTPALSQFNVIKLIESRCVLDRPITIDYKGRKQSTYVLDFKVELTKHPQAHATLALGIENVHESENNTVLKFDLNANITLRVSAIEFENISKEIEKNLSISIYGNPEKRIHFESDYDWQTVLLEDLIFTYHVGKLPKSSWYLESLRSHNAEFLNPLSLKHRGHVASIIDELAQSAAEADLIFDKHDKRLEIICEIIPELRVALREWKQDQIDSEYQTNLWAHSPEDFKKSILGLDKSEQKKLEDQYDTLWGNFEASAAITLGENNHGAASQGFEPNSEELDWIGERYLNLSPLRSKTLEKILVNSLLYIETVSYARTIKSNTKQFGSALGLRIFKDTEKDASYLGLATTFGNSLWTYAKYLVSEAVKIGLTFGLSIIITHENQTASWTITTGYTLYRWWRQIHFIQNEPTVKQTTLLIKMIDVQSLANKSIYNARYAQRRLEKVSDEGAVFSPLIFSILDRQIKLDSK